MKRIYLAFAVIVAGALAGSCVSEKQYDDLPNEKGMVNFVMKGVSTRAEAEASPVVNTYELGKDDEGHAFFLQETVTSLDGIGAEAPETRGMPAYTENVVTALGRAFDGVVYGSTGEIIGDGAFNLLPDNEHWQRDFGMDPWNVSDPVTFFLRMPSNATNVTNLSYDFAQGTMAFDYASPNEANQQQDLLLATRQIDKATYESEYKSQRGADVLFRHALTGVKFAIGNNTTQAGSRHPDNEVQTFITKVEFKGLKDRGHAVYKPVGTETVKDNRDEHTSAASITWSDIAAVDATETTPATPGTTRTTVFSQTYGDDDIQDFVSGDAVGAPASYYNTGANRNVNAADGSLTFWFIPQTITDDLQVTVTFYIWSGAEPKNGKKEYTLTLNLGEAILTQAAANRQWNAGQLRTFTLKPTMVDVEIEDKMNDALTIKSDVKIRNTGNITEYVRVNLIGNWVGKLNETSDWTIMNGYAQGNPEQDTQLDYTNAYGEVLPWNDKEPQNLTPTKPSDKNFNYGAFVGLPAKNATVNNWIRRDKYYYYKLPIGPGQYLASTDKLFESYTIQKNQIPDFWIADAWGNRQKAVQVHLEMDVIVQAVSALDAEGNVIEDYETAWLNALGEGADLDDL